jgi:hypothetical protein
MYDNTSEAAGRTADQNPPDERGRHTHRFR